MPIVVSYDDPALIGTLAAGAGRFAQNRIQQDQALREQAQSDAQSARMASINAQMQSAQMQADNQARQIDLQQQALTHQMAQGDRQQDWIEQAAPRHYTAAGPTPFSGSGPLAFSQHGGPQQSNARHKVGQSGANGYLPLAEQQRRRSAHETLDQLEQSGQVTAEQIHIARGMIESGGDPLPALMKETGQLDPYKTLKSAQEMDRYTRSIDKEELSRRERHAKDDVDETGDEIRRLEHRREQLERQMGKELQTAYLEDDQARIRQKFQTQIERIDKQLGDDSDAPGPESLRGQLAAKRKAYRQMLSGVGHEQPAEGKELSWRNGQVTEVPRGGGGAPAASGSGLNWDNGRLSNVGPSTTRWDGNTLANSPTAPAPAKPAAPPQSLGPIDLPRAQLYLQKANGDPVLAQQLAERDGWIVPHL